MHFTISSKWPTKWLLLIRLHILPLTCDKAFCYLALSWFLHFAFCTYESQFFCMNLSEGLWSAMAIINILEGYISWKWSCRHFFWAVWKCPCWYIGSWTSGPLWRCCRFSYNWYDRHIIYMDRKLWRCFWKQELARPIQGCCCGHCFWYSSYLR